MHRHGRTGLSLALLALAGGTAQACTPAPTRPTAPSGKTPRLSIVQADDGYIIRASVPAAPVVSASPCCGVSLGSSVRFDRDAILPSSTKEIEHGETR